MAGKRWTQAELERAFRAEAERVVNAVVVRSIFKLDELSSREMNSRRRKEQLAADLNREAGRLFKVAVREILANRLGTGANVVINPDWPGTKNPKYADFQQLSPGYLERKAEQKKPTPGYFRYSGRLALDLLSPELPLFQPDGVKVSRVLEDETWHKKKGGGYRLQKVVRNSRGLFDFKAHVTDGWTIELVVPEVFQGKHLRPESLIFEGHTLMKLTNGGVDSKRPYRPLLGPYLRWYSQVAIPRLIREQYTNKRRKK